MSGAASAAGVLAAVVAAGSPPLPGEAPSLLPLLILLRILLILACRRSAAYSLTHGAVRLRPAAAWATPAKAAIAGGAATAAHTKLTATSPVRATEPKLKN